MTIELETNLREDFTITEKASTFKNLLSHYTEQAPKNG